VITEGAGLHVGWAAYRPCPHAPLSPAWVDGARCAEWLGGLSLSMTGLDA